MPPPFTIGVSTTMTFAADGAPRTFVPSDDPLTFAPAGAPRTFAPSDDPQVSAFDPDDQVSGGLL